jgi:hypothetical protein
MAEIKNIDNFLNWYASLMHFNAANKIKNDVILDTLGSKRFVLGAIIEGKKSGTPILGVHYQDINAITSIPWEKVGIICGHQKSDWIALSCSDIRVKDAASPNPVPMRLWIQFPLDSMEPWIKNLPKEIELRRAKNNKRGKSILDKTPLIKLPVTVKNKWEDFA